MSIDFCRCPDCTKARDQQRELDAWIAENEQRSEFDGLCASSYNAGSAAAAEAVRQGNWTWEEYQEYLAQRAPQAEGAD